MVIQRRLVEKGFTLIEMVSVLVIVSVIAVTAAIRLPALNQDLPSAKNQILFALHYARVLALSQAATDTSVVVTVSSGSINLQLDSVSLQLASVNFPDSLPTSVSVQSGTGHIVFGQDGLTTARTIVISDGSASETVQLTGGGYAY